MITYDTNILIYALEGTDVFASAAQKVITQGEQHGAVLSVLAWQELMTGAVLKGNGLDATLATILRDFSVTKFVPVTQAICERATLLTKRYGKQVYGYDAVHIATALEHNIDTFITNDKTLLHLQIEGLRIQGL
jgi:predicted nucleic acid-binding protein